MGVGKGIGVAVCPSAAEELAKPSTSDAGSIGSLMTTVVDAEAIVEDVISEISGSVDDSVGVGTSVILLKAIVARIQFWLNTNAVSLWLARRRNLQRRSMLVWQD